MVSIKTNMSVLVAQRHMSNAHMEVADAQKKLRSGSRIEGASDDAAGMQISNALQVQTRGLDTAMSNAINAFSVAETAEGALHENSEMLQKLRDLALQSANGSNSRDDREAINIESKMLVDDIDRIARDTTFAGDNLFSGRYGSQSFHLGADGNSISLTLRDMQTDVPSMGGQFVRSETPGDESWVVSNANDELTIDYEDAKGQDQSINISLVHGDDINEVATYINAQQDVVTASVTEDLALQVFSSHRESPQGFELSGSLAGELDFSDAEEAKLHDIDLTTVGGAQLAVGVVDASIKYVDSHRAEIGAFQNRVDNTMDNIRSMEKNISAAKGQIQDADYARVTTELVKSQVLQQATSALYAQANQGSRAALSFLG